jgi:hypothetical protein
VSELSLTPVDAQKTAKVIAAVTFWDDDVAAGLREWSMLFTFEDVRGRFAELCQQWLEVSRRHQTAFEIYFGSLYRPPGYTDLRFSLLAQALSLYTEARSAEAVEGTISSAELPRNVQELLDTHPVVTVEKTLTALSTEFSAYFSPLVSEAGGKSEDFIEYATNTVRYTLTRTPPAGPHASDGSDLYWLCERMAFLFKIAVLSDLGFPPEQIGRLLERNRSYRHLCDMARMKK